MKKRCWIVGSHCPAAGLGALVAVKVLDVIANQCDCSGAGVSEKDCYVVVGGVIGLVFEDEDLLSACWCGKYASEGTGGPDEDDNGHDYYYDDEQQGGDYRLHSLTIPTSSKQAGTLPSFKT